MTSQILLELVSMKKSLIVVVITAVVLFALLFLNTRRISLAKNSNAFVGCFYGLNFTNKLRMTFSVLKLLFVFSFLVEFNKLELCHFMVAFVLISLIFLFEMSDSKCISNLLMNLSLLAGIYIVSILHNYRNSVYDKTGFTIIIIATCIFVMFYEVYIFLEEINLIERRKAFRRW